MDPSVVLALQDHQWDSLTRLGLCEKAKILLRFERFPFRFCCEVIGLHIVITKPESVFLMVFRVMRRCGSSYAHIRFLRETPESQGFVRTVSGVKKTIAEKLQKSRKKVFTGSDWGPITRLHRRGAAPNETATRTWRFGASAFEFFDIVDQKEGMRGQRYGAT
ncbi:MAG: hypothetical protein CMO08_08245, partial [Thalassospira sp.]|nr:hypothetical protein [Thalassospira sp.]